jgi:uncharacterized protein (TIGR03032 family)
MGSAVLDKPKSDPAEVPAEPADQAAAYSMSPGFVPFLRRSKVSVALTSYQSGRLYLLGLNREGGLNVDERPFQKAMGLAVEGQTLVLATHFQIHRFGNTLKAGELINNHFDACYVPRVSYNTGVLDAHDVGLLKSGEVIFVNTRFNCLATPSGSYSFAPLWKPPFISGIVDEDRCHLNGMAMLNGEPRYVTAASRSNTIDGWRDRRADGGVAIDVRTGQIVCSGLSMPHSPRLYRDRLWVLNSGAGELGWIDLEDNSFRTLAFCPGFVRGLAFHDRYAFVGLSKPRYQRFEGLALDARLIEADSEPWCGVQVIDLETGACVEWFRIDGAVAEIFDVGVIAGVASPMSLGFDSGDIGALITHAGMQAGENAAPD